MKKRNRIGQIGIVCGLVVLAAGWAMAETSATSEEVVLDTRRMSSVPMDEGVAMDVRTHTVDWSEAGRLNTRELIGTMIRVM